MRSAEDDTGSEDGCSVIHSDIDKVVVVTGMVAQLILGRLNTMNRTYN